MYSGWRNYRSDNAHIVKNFFSSVGLTRLSDANRSVFKNMCLSNSGGQLDYSNSWNYLIQSTFFGGWKYLADDSFVVVTTRYPNCFPVVITKMLGASSLDNALSLASELKKLTGQKIIFKNIGPSFENSMKKRGLTDYAPGDGWSKRYHFDDDTFSQATVSLQDMRTLCGPTFKSLRYRVNALRRKHNVLVKEFNASLLDDALLVLNTWRDSFLNRFAKELVMNPLDAHSVDLHESYVRSKYSGYDPNNGVFSFLLYVDGKPSGFSLAEKISDDAVGLYSNISSNEFQGLSECLVYETLCACAKEGFSYANLGGSEFSSLHNFKKKFASSFIQKKHLVLY